MNLKRQIQTMQRIQTPARRKTLTQMNPYQMRRTLLTTAIPNLTIRMQVVLQALNAKEVTAQTQAIPNFSVPKILTAEKASHARPQAFRQVSVTAVLMRRIAREAA